MLPREWRLLLRRWSKQVVDVQKMLRAPRRFLRFLRDWRVYKQLAGAEECRFLDTYPCLHDATANAPFDVHYFYQDVWAARHIARANAQLHIDVGSRVDFVGFLTAITKVVFLDIRPLKATVGRLQYVKADIVRLPLPDSSVSSLSCLHVAEHIGLGRYGDKLDPLGTVKAAAELGRVLAQAGTLYFSVPIGVERVCFNAHRIFAPRTVLAMFPGLRLDEFSMIDDDGNFRENVSIETAENARYSCGLFRLRKG